MEHTDSITRFWKLIVAGVVSFPTVSLPQDGDLANL